VYRSVVRHAARRAFAQLSRADLDAFMKNFAADATFCLGGEHALGGEQRGRDAIRLLAARMHRLFPGIAVEPRTIVVTGWPWDTVMCTRFTVTAQLGDGETYRNEGMQFARLRWGKVVEDRLYEDTQLLADALAKLAARGVDEAAAPPIGRTLGG
jgi:ketosteroid isomerase-like protein